MKKVYIILFTCIFLCHCKNKPATGIGNGFTVTLTDSKELGSFQSLSQPGQALTFEPTFHNLATFFDFQKGHVLKINDRGEPQAIGLAAQHIFESSQAILIQNQNLTEIKFNVDGIPQSGCELLTFTKTATNEVPICLNQYKLMTAQKINHLSFDQRERKGVGVYGDNSYFHSLNSSTTSLYRWNSQTRFREKLYEDPQAIEVTNHPFVSADQSVVCSLRHNAPMICGQLLSSTWDTIPELMAQKHEVSFQVGDYVFTGNKYFHLQSYHLIQEHEYPVESDDNVASLSNEDALVISGAKLIHISAIDGSVMNYGPTWVLLRETERYIWIYGASGFRRVDRLGTGAFDSESFDHYIEGFFGLTNFSLTPGGHLRVDGFGPENQQITIYIDGTNGELMNLDSELVPLNEVIQLK